MSSTDRQNNLLISEDWKKIYQSFRNADFQSYDFENLRRTMIQYLRTNYPEDFNDYIESSEYLALIDLIAFLGQSVAFRVDLNARENFLELASRRDSVLRLARLISYNAKRNIAAQGLLKFTTVQTTETVIDSNGRNIANQVVTWNDPSNTNWYDQFIRVINAGLPQTQQFGNPIASATIYGIPTSQYRFNATNTNVPVFSFTATVAGRSMNFEITSTTFSGQSFIYEEAPKLGLAPACVYRDDGHGSGSSGTGFFFNFTQGNLQAGQFTVTQPSSNESIDIATQNINNNDIWLYQLDQNGLESNLWTQVSATTGNNVIYNSLNKNIKDIYTVVTRAGDQVSLAFSDGTFGTLPLGSFRTYYRISNGLSYVVNPADIKNVSISIPYTSASGSAETLTLSLSLLSTVNNATASEDNASVKTNAPQTYYTQNRMITGEDYNISPLSVTQAVAKVKSVNRASSGISRYFDLADPTGKYSSTNLFADDGIIYQDTYTTDTQFSYTTKVDIEGVIYNKITDILSSYDLANFYYNSFVNFLTSSLSIAWYETTSDSLSSTGYIGAVVDSAAYKVGTYTNTDLKYLSPGALIKFTAPSGKYFDTLNGNNLVTGTATSAGATSYIWAEVASVSGDGTANNTGVLPSGLGPITLNQPIPSGAVLAKLVPKLTTSISSSVVTTMIDLVFANKPFGLRYDATTQTWQIIFESNLNTISSFSLGNQGDQTNSQQDSSWLLLFTTDNQVYTVTTRLLRYIFESDQQVRFYFDSTNPIYDSSTGTIISDIIKILSVNTQPDSTSAFTIDQPWRVTKEYSGLDGYIDNQKILVSFGQNSNDGTIVDPEIFLNIVAPSTAPLTKYIIQKKYTLADGQEDYQYVSNSAGTVIIAATQASVQSTLTSYKDGQYFYFVDTGVVKQLALSTVTLTPSLDYKVYVGRDKLKFQYTHSADYNSRIDPSASNIIDIYILTKNYDTSFRQWLVGANVSEPLPPSSDELYNLISPNLNLIKSISDEIVYHPVSYKILFGSTASTEVQATFKVTKNSSSVVSDNDIKARVITAINTFFALDNWNFGDTFYFTELSTYVMNQLVPDITNFVIVPKQTGLYFGSLFEIQCPSNQIFINGATVDDIEIISSITGGNIKSVTGNGLTTITSNQNVTSANYGALNG
jgi:hypothetical protein